MEWVSKHWLTNPKSAALAAALRAAMVRLEEAEKERDHYYTRVMLLASEAEVLDRGFNVANEARKSAESQVAALTASLASVTKEMDKLQDEMNLLFKSGPMTEMRERVSAAERLADIRLTELNKQAASLAELRKRTGEAEKEYRARFLAELWTLLPERSHGYNDIVRYVQQASTAALASPPSPAPSCVCGDWTKPGITHREDGPCYMSPAPVESKPYRVELNTTDGWVVWSQGPFASEAEANAAAKENGLRVSTYRVESKPKDCCRKIRTAFGNVWECARPSGHRGECGLKVMPDDEPAADTAKPSPDKI